MVEGTTFSQPNLGQETVYLEDLYSKEEMLRPHLRRR